MRHIVLLAVGLVLLAVQTSRAATAHDYLGRSDDWFRSGEAARIGQNILSWQAHEGGWPKNEDTTSSPAPAVDKLKGTFDNGATTDELRFLARLIEARAPNSSSASNAFLRGLGHILHAQYTNGGWPQYSPPPANSYHRYITFNDGTMVRLLIFLREVVTEPRYQFVPASTRDVAQRAFQRGVDCILQCQVRMNGRLTVWCAQHDEKTLAPRPARTFELASLSGAESVSLTRLLMSLTNPAPATIEAIESSVAWLKSARIEGIKLVEVKDASLPKGRDRVVEKDASARSMWARFYEIETGRPIYAGRDGVKKYALAEIEYERRNGYSWLNYWPETLLEKEYPAWKANLVARGR